jgi:hypothetical protein
MTVQSPPSHIHPLWYLASIFFIAVTVNYVWELTQASLFDGWEDWGNIWLHCFAASLGDGTILLIIYAIGWAVFKRRDWFIDPGVSGYAVMLATGLTVAIAIEWGAVHVLERWEYGPNMPLVPGIDIGLVPLLQMLILPPIIFYIVRIWIMGKK